MFTHGVGHERKDAGVVRAIYFGPIPKPGTMPVTGQPQIMAYLRLIVLAEVNFTRTGQAQAVARAPGL
jgi:hypothetical protein